MLDIEQIKLEIIERLKPLNPNKIILFGSYAYGTPNRDSDIDLYVVTNDDFMPQSWREKNEIYLKFSTAIKEIMQEYPTDLIIHTQAMYKKFKEMDSLFSQNVLNNGVVIL
jgi:predicted nucleotidyltransferase